MNQMTPLQQYFSILNEASFRPSVRFGQLAEQMMLHTHQVPRATQPAWLQGIKKLVPLEAATPATWPQAVSALETVIPLVKEVSSDPLRAACHQSVSEVMEAARFSHSAPFKRAALSLGHRYFQQ